MKHIDFSRINLLICDVDGVLTDGGMYYDINGNEWKKFNTKDGKGIELLRNIGIKAMFLTGEDTPIVKRRAKKLHVDYCFMGVQDKKAFLEKFFSEHSELDFSYSAYIGDDVNDVLAMKCVAFAATPADGMEENRSVADYVCKTRGGRGCVREICNLLVQEISDK